MGKDKTGSKKNVVVGPGVALASSPPANGGPFHSVVSLDSTMRLRFSLCLTYKRG
jgi:hypothetical protein